MTQYMVVQDEKGKKQIMTHRKETEEKAAEAHGSARIHTYGKCYQRHRKAPVQIWHIEISVQTSERAIVIGTGTHPLIRA